MSEQRLKEILTADDQKRQQFHNRLGALRMRNNMLSREQLELRKKRKPSKGAVNKSLAKALEITVLLRLMRKLKGMPMTYMMPERKCKCGAILRKAQEREIHALPKDETGRLNGERIEYEIVTELRLYEFFEENQE